MILWSLSVLGVNGFDVRVEVSAPYGIAMTLHDQDTYVSFGEIRSTVCRSLSIDDSTSCQGVTIGSIAAAAYADEETLATSGFSMEALEYSTRSKRSDYAPSIFAVLQANIFHSPWAESVREFRRRHMCMHPTPCHLHLREVTKAFHMVVSHDDASSSVTLEEAMARHRHHAAAMRVCMETCALLFDSEKGGHSLETLLDRYKSIPSSPVTTISSDIYVSTM